MKSHQPICRSGPRLVNVATEDRLCLNPPHTYQKETYPHQSGLHFFLPLICQIWSEVWRLPQPCSPLWCRPCCRWASKPAWWKVWFRQNTCWQADSTLQCPTWSATCCRRSRRTERGRHRAEVTAGLWSVLLTVVHFRSCEKIQVWVRVRDSNGHIEVAVMLMFVCFVSSRTRSETELQHCESENAHGHWRRSEVNICMKLSLIHNFLHEHVPINPPQ